MTPETRARLAQLHQEALELGLSTSPCADCHDGSVIVCGDCEEPTAALSVDDFADLLDAARRLEAINEMRSMIVRLFTDLSSRVGECHDVEVNWCQECGDDYDDPNHRCQAVMVDKSYALLKDLLALLDAPASPGRERGTDQP